MIDIEFKYNKISLYEYLEYNMDIMKFILKTLHKEIIHYHYAAFEIDNIIQKVELEIKEALLNACDDEDHKGYWNLVRNDICETLDYYYAFDENSIKEYIIDYEKVSVNKTLDEKADMMMDIIRLSVDLAMEHYNEEEYSDYIKAVYNKLEEYEVSVRNNTYNLSNEKREEFRDFLFEMFMAFEYAHNPNLLEDDYDPRYEDCDDGYEYEDECWECFDMY
jgi:hypothetical protein